MTPNRKLDRIPRLAWPHRLVASPRWFTHLLRIYSFVFGSGIAALTASNWSQMPWPVRGLALALAPMLVGLALHPSGWRRFSSEPFLIVDTFGLYLPACPGSRTPRSIETPWLFIPWDNVLGVRLDRLPAGESRASPCVALDVHATSDEIATFFLGRLSRQPRIDTDAVAAAIYCHALPRLTTVVAWLEELGGPSRLAGPKTGGH